MVVGEHSENFLRNKKRRLPMRELFHAPRQRRTQPPHTENLFFAQGRKVGGGRPRDFLATTVPINLSTSKSALLLRHA
jgi:hypothetical protein